MGELTARLELIEARLKAVESAAPAARMVALEKIVRDQSTVITALSQRAVEAEENFQRLISAVERLFEQKGIVPAGTAGISPAAFEPFEKELTDAMQQGPVAAPGGFRPRIVSEEEAKSTRHRRPLSRL